MKLTYPQIESIYTALENLHDKEMPFKLVLLFAKNLKALEQEREFYLEKEREFAMKYLERDGNGQFIQSTPGAFKIVVGLEDECQEARKALDNFENEVMIYKLPISELEKSDIQFTPAQMMALSDIIDEEG